MGVQRLIKRSSIGGFLSCYEKLDRLIVRIVGGFTLLFVNSAHVVLHHRRRLVVIRRALSDPPYLRNDLLVDRVQARFIVIQLRVRRSVFRSVGRNLSGKRRLLCA